MWRYGIFALVLIQISVAMGAVIIPNGIEIGDSEYSMTVKLTVQHEEGKTHCTGTYIRPHVILTAAHCVYSIKTGKRAKHWEFKTKSGLERSTRARTHPKFISTYGEMKVYHFENDVAVIYAKGVGPSVARITKDAPVIKQGVTLVGYGLDSASDYWSESATQKPVLRRFGHNIIGKVDPYRIHVFGYRDSASDPKLRGVFAGIAPGDSGGPLFSNGELIGVISQFGEHSLGAEFNSGSRSMASIPEWLQDADLYLFHEAFFVRLDRKDIQEFIAPQ